MAVSTTWYGSAGKHVAAGEIAFLTDTIKCILVNQVYAFDKNGHETYADVKAYEIATFGGYVAGGAALSTKTLVYDPTTQRTRYFCSNTVWTPGPTETLVAYGAIIYKVGASEAASWLMSYIDFGEQVSVTGTGFTIQYDTTDGILYLQA